MTKEEYEDSRPENEHKIDLGPTVIRAYIRENGETVVMVHRKSVDGFEELPLGYILGSNYVIHKPRK